jgi:hypothetical protein
MNGAQLTQLVGAGLRAVTCHEVGHILGLRHNFKGSLGVSYECTQDKNCTAQQGLTASIMDYIPMNLPELGQESREVDFFTPVVGGYDKLAIRYGYENFEDTAQLEAVAREAENFEVCYDDQSHDDQDPGCMAYDFTSDPLQYFDKKLDRIAAVQRVLRNKSVGPGMPYTDYGSALDRVFNSLSSVSSSVVQYLGGVNLSFVHKGADQQRVSRTPLSAHDQRRALSILMRFMRPQQQGFVLPDDDLPYVVLSSHDHMGTLRSAHMATAHKALSRNIIGNILSRTTLSRVIEEESFGLKLLDHSSVFTSGELIAKLVDSVTSEGMNTTDPEEWDLHMTLVTKLRDALELDLPEDVSSHIRHHLWRIEDRVGKEFNLMKAAELNARNLADGSLGDEPLQSELLFQHQRALRSVLTSSDDSLLSVHPEDPPKAGAHAKNSVGATTLMILLAVTARFSTA